MTYEPPEMNRPASGSGKKPPNRRIRRLVLLCLSLLLITYGAVRLVLYFSDLALARRTTQELREVSAETKAPAPTEEPAPETASPPPAETEPEAPEETLPPTDADAASKGGTLPAVEYPNGYELDSRIRKLRQKSQYIIGWITMDDLDEPVVLKDNTFFLNHDAMGNRNANGAIFMDEDTGLLTRPYTVMLYGHNMKTGAMFGNLRKYEDSAYCYKHRLLRFDTLYEQGEYVIFSVCTVTLTPGRGRYVSLTDIASSDRAARKQALKSLSDLCPFDMMLDVNEEDQVLLLITCVGDDDERLIVAARRLREGETAEKLTLKSI